MTYLQYLVSSPRREAMRDTLGIPTLSSSQVEPIVDEKLCRAAAVLMNRDRRSADTTRRSVQLFKLGMVYYAEDSELRAGEWTLGYVLDAELRRIVKRAAR
jgi:hypothetical protein